MVIISFRLLFVVFRISTEVSLSFHCESAPSVRYVAQILAARANKRLYQRISIGLLIFIKKTMTNINGQTVIKIKIIVAKVSKIS
ncbi:hypothetical protein D3C72_2106080 [compost metagenome]